MNIVELTVISNLNKIGIIIKNPTSEVMNFCTGYSSLTDSAVFF